MSSPAIDATLRSGPNPFEDRVVHNTRRGDVPDAREIHAPIRERIQRAIDSAGTTGLGSFLVIGGQVGRGKTHLLSRIRAESVERGYTFVEIEPLRDAEAPLLHVLRYVGAALRAPDSAPWLVLRTPLERAFYESLLAACTARVKAGAVPAHPAIVALFDEARTISQETGADSMSVDRFALRCAEAWPQIEQPLRAELIATPPFNLCDAGILQILFRLPSIRRTDLVSAYLSGECLAADELDLIGAREEIDDESKAMRVLSTLLPLGRHAVVLAFDQLESAVASVGIAGVQNLFSRLTDVRDRGGPAVILASCQTQVWHQIEPGLTEQVKDRIEEPLLLQAPLREDATALTQVRLASLGVARPHPIYPFSADVIEAIYKDAPPNTPRELLKKLASRWEVWRAGVAVASGSPPPPDPPPAAPPTPSPTQVIADAINEEARRIRPRDVARRADRVRVLLEQTLIAARSLNAPVQGVNVRQACTTRPSPNTAATGMEFVLESAGVTRRVRIEANDEPHGNSPRFGIQRLLEARNAQTADAAFLLRREDQPLTTVASQLGERLAATGGGVIYIPETTAIRAEASIRVIDIASAGGLPNGIDRPTTLRHVIQAELPNLDAWRTILARTFAAAAPVTANPPAPPPPPAATSASPPTDRVLQFLTEGSRVTTELRIEQTLKLDKVLLSKALEELAARGDVQRMKDQHGNAMVMIAARRA